MDHARATAEAALSGLDDAGFGAVVADAHGRLLAANVSAADVIAENDALTVHNLRLLARTAAATRALYCALGEASVGATVILPRNCRPPLLGLVRPLRTPPHAGAVGPGALLLLRDPARSADPDVAALGLLYPFTRSELTVIRSLAAGHDAAAIAQDSGSSVQTVRTHIRNAMRKAGAHRQSELVALALRPLPMRVDPAVPIAAYGRDRSGGRASRVS